MISIVFRNASSERTRVTRAVLPDPLGPTNKMEGNVVSPADLKTTVCKKMGIVTARSIAIRRAVGVGFSIECSSPVGGGGRVACVLLIGSIVAD